MRFRKILTMDIPKKEDFMNALIILKREKKEAGKNFLIEIRRFSQDGMGL